jgi:preprotein translocase subunit SecD
MMKSISICATMLVAIVPAGPTSAETLKIDVQSVEAGVDPLTTQPIVTLTLTPQSTTAVGEFTKARVGEQVKMRVGEMVLSEPTIREPITQGTLVINGNFTEESAQSLADAIVKAGKTFEVDGSDK